MATKTNVFTDLKEYTKAVRKSLARSIKKEEAKPLTREEMDNALKSCNWYIENGFYDTVMQKSPSHVVLRILLDDSISDNIYKF